MRVVRRVKVGVEWRVDSRLGRGGGTDHWDFDVCSSKLQNFEGYHQHLDL
jgi:hypothetical protein